MNAPKPTESLKDFTLTDKNRKDAKLKDTVFLRKLETWASIKIIVRDYFMLADVYAPTPHTFYNQVLQALTNLNNEEAKIKKGVKAYCLKLHSFYSNVTNKLAFFEEYESLDRDIRKQKAQHVLDAENNIAGNIMVGNMVKEASSNLILSPHRDGTLQKRTHEEMVDNDDETHDVTSQPLENPFTDKRPKSFITVNKFDKAYSIHAPAGNVKSPNKPALQEEDIEQFKKFASICTSNVMSGTPETQHEYDQLMNEQRLNKSLKVEASHYDKALAITRMESMDKLEEFIGDIRPKDTFTKFLKYAASDYYINCLRATPYSISDERTIYCEVIIPLFKLFGNITGQITHVWCEKAQPESRVLYLETHDYSLKGFDKKLLDGIGTISDIPRTYLIFDSSGFDKVENINHNIENNIKNMKSATDSLKYCAGRFKSSSYATFTKVHVFTIHVIQDKMSMTRYSYNDSQKFDIVEARSCELPLTFKDKKKFLKLMEFFSFLYRDLQEQALVFDQLDDERNGIIDIEELDMVKNVLR